MEEVSGDCTEEFLERTADCEGFEKTEDCEGVEQTVDFEGDEIMANSEEQTDISHEGSLLFKTLTQSLEPALKIFVNRAVTTFCNT